MRVLAASTAGSGHFAPLRPVLDALTRKGDEVLLVVPPGLAGAAAESGHAFRIGEDPPAAELADIWARVPVVSRDEAAILVNREIFGRLDTAAMLPAVEQACDDWAPDLVIHEPAEFASAVAAERRGLPHVQVAIGLASVEVSSIRLAAPVLERFGAGFVDGLLASPYLTRFPASLDPPAFATTVRFREIPENRRKPLPDWWNGDDTALVYVSFGTVAGSLPVGATLYRDACDALAGLPVRVLLTTGRTRDLGDAGPLPPNVHAETWVDQQAALAISSLVVCHGGAGTTFGALEAGLPLVVVPLMADQPRNGRLVASAGAGVVVDPGAAGEGPEPVVPLPLRLRAAVEKVLGEPSYRVAARQIADEMRGLPALDDVVSGLV